MERFITNKRTYTVNNNINKTKKKDNEKYAYINISKYKITVGKRQRSESYQFLLAIIN